MRTREYFVIGSAFLLVGILGSFAFSAFAAPTFRLERTILPETGGDYSIGTTTRPYGSLTATSVCIGSDCRNVWPSGNIASLNGSTSSTQVFATSTSANTFKITTANGTHTFTIPSNLGFFTNDSGYLATTTGNWIGTFDGQEGTFYLSRANHTGTQTASTISDFVATARTSISETITGLEYDNSTGVFSTSTGYTIPFLASTTNWEAFYQTPSSRITAGTNMTWNGNQLDGKSDSSIRGLFSSGTGISYDNSTGVITNASPHVTSTIVAGGGTATGNAFTFATSGPLMSVLCGTSTCTFTTLATSSLGIPHSSLTGLTTDDHTQYALLVGRSGGQTLIGGTASGDDLTLMSTSNATQGNIFFGASSTYDGVRAQFGLNTLTPGVILNGAIDVRSGRIIHHIKSTTGIAELAIEGTGGAGAIFEFQNNSNSVDAKWIAVINDADYLNWLSVKDTGITNRDKILVMKMADGNVGINTSSFGTSAVRVLGFGPGTAPTTSPTDVTQLWSADRGGTAAKAGLHIRSEDGTSHVFSDRVGLGTTTPQTAVQVWNAASSTLAVGASAVPGCLVMGDSDGSGVTYVTVANGVLSATTTKPAVCQVLP